MSRSSHRPNQQSSCVLAGSGFLCVMLGSADAAPYQSQDGAPAEIRLGGIVRDFRERTAQGGHPDFEREPDNGFGHYVGNIALRLGDDGHPVFTGGGNKVVTQARDSQGRPIAPHLCDSNGTSGGDNDAQPSEHTTAILRDSDGVDAYEVSLISAEFNSDGTSTWMYHVRELGTGKDLSHWALKLEPTHHVMPGTSAGYDFGLDGSTDFYGIKWDVEDEFAEGTFTIVLDQHYLGDVDWNGVLVKGGRDDDHEGLFVPTDELATNDSPFPSESSGSAHSNLGDIEGTLGVADNGGIQSVDSFNQWFHDVLGVNVSAPLTLTLVGQSDGTYLFDDLSDSTFNARGGFFPVDGRAFGNSGGSPDHNFHFTYELQATFTYDASVTQFFQVTGNDDVWVFIDANLVIDLGGVHGATDQYVDLSRLGLEDGQTYTLDLFSAQRHRTQSHFRISTNLVLTGGSISTVSLVFD